MNNHVLHTQKSYKLVEKNSKWKKDDVGLPVAEKRMEVRDCLNTHMHYVTQKELSILLGNATNV